MLFRLLVWRIVHLTNSIPPQSNITNMFSNWLKDIDVKTKAGTLIGFTY
jgi:hypothetical protein